MIPIWFAIVTTASMLVGRILGSLFRLRQSQRLFIAFYCSFSLISPTGASLSQPPCSWTLTPFQSPWCKVSFSRSQTSCGEAMTIKMSCWVVLWLILQCIAPLEWSYVHFSFSFYHRKDWQTVRQLRYSYGVKLLSRADTILNQPEGTVDERTPLLEDNTILHSQPSSSTLRGDIAGCESDSDSAFRPPKAIGSSVHATPPNLAPIRRNTAFYNSFPNSPNDSRANLDRYDSISTTDTEDGVETILPTHSHPNNCLHRSWRRVARLGAILNSFMTVPIWSALLSLLVACIQPFQHALLNHMQPVNNAITTAGKCSVPLTLVVLGAYFHTPDETMSSSSSSSSSSKTLMQRIRGIRDVFRPKLSPTNHSQENQTKPGETKTIILSVVSRMIITPVLLIPAMAMATRYDWHTVFQE